MIEYLIRRGTLLTVGVFIVLIFGILAATRVPVQMIPDLEVRTISIQTRWPGGATPQDVEKKIVIEQEQYLRNLPNLQRMIPVASTGQATVELEFPFGTDINEALIRVNNALSQVPAYPENVDEPVLFTNSFSANAFLYFAVTPLPGNPRDIDMNMMRDFVDDEVRTRMERVPGVSQVELRGGAERQIQILVDPVRLAQRGNTLTDLRDAVRSRNRDISGGDVDSGKRRYLLRTVGRFEDIEAIGDLILRRQGDSITRLKDVAEVKLGHFEIRGRSFSSGEPSLTLAVRRETGSNVIEIKEAILPVVDRLNKDVLEPEGLSARLVSDDVRYVEASVANVWQNLAIGAVLASAVMFIFLRSVPATLVGMGGIPICTVAAIIGLLVTGRTINVISLAGIAFAIGMTLDNTIVVLENIERQRQRGLRGFEAAISGVVSVWPAVLASTLTTVFVFAPGSICPTRSRAALFRHRHRDLGGNFHIDACCSHRRARSVCAPAVWQIRTQPRGMGTIQAADSRGSRVAHTNRNPPVGMHCDDRGYHGCSACFPHPARRVSARGRGGQNVLIADRTARLQSC